MGKSELDSWDTEVSLLSKADFRFDEKENQAMHGLIIIVRFCGALVKWIAASLRA